MAGALEGVIILDLTQALAGPFGSMLLGDLGAETIKIEPPGQRRAVEGGVVYKGETIHFLATNRNKKSIILDLKMPEGKQVFYELTRKADIVFDNYRAGVPEKLGVDYDTLKGMNPRIISCSVTGFGSPGPYQGRPAYDLIIQAISGGMSITGDPPPARAGLPFSDLCAGMFAVQGIIAALYHRERTGMGQRVEASLLDGQIALLTYCVPDYFISGETVGPVGIGQRADPTYRMFRTSDDYIVIAASPGPRFWEKLCRALGQEELATDPRFDSPEKRHENAAELAAIMEDIFLSQSAGEWLACLIREGVPAGPVNTIDKALKDPQVWHQKMIVPIDYVSGGQIKVAGNPIKMSAAEPAYKSPPTFGQHTEEVLSRFLGYSSEKIAGLRNKKVIN